MGLPARRMVSGHQITDKKKSVCGQIAALEVYRKSNLGGCGIILLMADLINLHRHRKRLRREAAEQIAAIRRLEFGRSKAQKTAESAQEQRRANLLDGHRRIREDET
ncbi:DUF4169 family protein [Ancylobacter mangrovi]|uniref:DUF4169 family protein n=1 Tax=Ancylobacter mangrovi TaxID=2972472 RepID=UPI002162E1A5|nr:DUF4169 family protein [Ancylobacter mangrovi]MCS0503852.1 DUF4169 family protein [Ancylobacter mangrovi]